MFKKKTKNLKDFILVINIREGKFHLCSYIQTASRITGMNRNDMAKITELTTHKHFIIVPVKEEV